MGESTLGRAWAMGIVNNNGNGSNPKGITSIFSSDDKMTDGEEKIVSLPIDQIQPTEQVRKYFDEEELKTLADSLAKKGQLQPIAVYKSGDGDKYTIAYGERRWRAAQMNKWKTIKAIIRPAPKNPEQLIELQITENLHRTNPNVMELADATAKLVKHQIDAGLEKNAAYEEIEKLLSCKKTMIYNLMGIYAISDPEKQTLVDTSIYFMAGYLPFRQKCRDNKLQFCEQFINKVNEEISKLSDQENTKKKRKEIIRKLFEQYNGKVKKAITPKVAVPADNSILGKKLSVSWKKIDKISPDFSQRFEQYVTEHSDMKLEEIIAVALEKLMEDDR